MIRLSHPALTHLHPALTCLHTFPMSHTTPLAPSFQVKADTIGFTQATTAEEKEECSRTSHFPARKVSAGNDGQSVITMPQQTEMAADTIPAWFIPLKSNEPIVALKPEPKLPVSHQPYDSLMLAMPNLQEISHSHNGRMAGDALPFSFRNDDFVTGGLLLCLFLTILVTARGMRYLSTSVKAFMNVQHHENLFDEEADTKMHGRSFLLFQTCISMGILSFDFVQERMPDCLSFTTPHILLGLNVAICCLWVGLKILVYYQVNRVLFERESAQLWMDAFLLLLIATGLSLLPITLLVIYFDLSFHYQQYLIFLTAIIAEILLCYKTKVTFFRYRLGGVHLILYLCALEIIPLLILWRGMVWANTWIATLN